MNKENFSAGTKGERTRSDCYVELELKSSGGIKLNLQSKVEAMYGKSINLLIKDILKTFKIRNASVLVEDYGALPFTIAARVESAIKNIFPDKETEFLLQFNKKSLYKTTKDRLRRSRLYLPGNEPKYFINAGLHKPDGVILDLEDSVAPPSKHDAKYLVRNALRSVDFYGCERMVRINQLPAGLEDLKFIVPHNIHVILIPKAEHAEHIKQVDEVVLKIKKEKHIKNDIFFMPIIESAMGDINA
jgi:citrate lyase subunit beta/citryl-CoA lyase